MDREQGSYVAKPPKCILSTIGYLLIFLINSFTPVIYFMFWGVTAMNPTPFLCMKRDEL